MIALNLKGATYIYYLEPEGCYVDYLEPEGCHVFIFPHPQNFDEYSEVSSDITAVAEFIVAEKRLMINLR